MDDPGNPTVNFHGEKHSNGTRQSTTVPEARLFRKGPGKDAKLTYMGHAVADDKYALAVASDLTLATGRAEAEAAAG